MHIAHKSWVSAISLMFLTAACGDSRAPTDAGPQTAQFATTASECEGQILALRENTRVVSITGRNADKELASLVGKLDEALGKLSIGKNADAVQKLNDFSAKVQALKAAGKIDPVSAGDLVAQANAAIGCINGIEV